MMARIESDFLIGVIIIFVIKIQLCTPVDWDQVRCSSDINQEVPEGKVEIGRFPWLGVVQHIFYLAEGQQFAVTTGVLIHPGYAIAAAEDIVRIPRERLLNNTKFVVWYSDTIKFAIDVQDYLLHPEYEEKVTFATLALLELYTAGETGISDMATVVLPVCLPVKGIGTFESIYAAHISDDHGEIGKQVFKMNYVPSKECEEYYYNTELSYEMMKPRRSICAKAEHHKQVCVWDSGVALITRMSWGHWMLLGVGMRGPGCSAPARFVNINDYIPWMDEVMTRMYGIEQGLVRINFRRQNPHTIHMYQADVKLPKEIGQCERKERGTVMYKENAEVVTTKNFAQGFYFVSVQQVTGFKCVTVNIESLARSNAAVWIENRCHQDATGLSPGQQQDQLIRRLECFVYFKTTAYVEIRFFFSFRAMFEITMYGTEELPYRMPNPISDKETTESWWPTDTFLERDSFSLSN